jgi:two-component system OmpR family response regulator
MKQKLILIVEDEAAIADVVEFALRKAGFETIRATTLAAARQLLHSRGADLLVLDLGLPDGDGLDLCRELSQTAKVPVLVLTCRDEEVDRVVGLESGADDYVVKPFSPRELTARVRSILRRSARTAVEPQDETLRHGRITVVPSEHRVALDEHDIRLTPVELSLLAVLLRSPARVYSRTVLIERIYQPSCYLSERTIDSHIKGIRRKFTSIDPGADPIETVFGVGYRARAIR